MNSHTPVEYRFRQSLPSEPARRAQQPVRTVTSESLFQGATEIAIEHGGSIYRLKITRQGKLILNK